MQPIRRKVEPGIYARLAPDGERRGLEIVWKDSDGRTRRRAVTGGVQAARDALAQARSRRVNRRREPADVRVAFGAVAEAFEQAHIPALRPNSQSVYLVALDRLRPAFGEKRMTSITRLDVRAFVAAERKQRLKANTIDSHLSVLSAVFAFARDDLGIPVVMPRLKPSERPKPVDDQREHRVLSDPELACVLDACGDRDRLFFRALAETGARQSEMLGLAARRVGADEITFAEQLSRDGTLAPLKTRQSRRTIEITRGLAAELRIAAGPERVFAHLTHRAIGRAWARALERARIPGDPQPVIHDLRHTHASGLIADGWDPVEVADRLGDTLATTLKVYAHEFDTRRRSEQRRSQLEARYGAKSGEMATPGSQPTATGRDKPPVDLAALRQVRNGA